MIIGELKTKIYSILTMFWTGGITNPLDVIEHITYLIFIRDLDGMDNIRLKESTMFGVSFESILSLSLNRKQYKWSVFRDFFTVKMYEVIQDKAFSFIKKLYDDKKSTYSKYMDDAIFKLPLLQLLEKVIIALNKIDWKNKDICGNFYRFGFMDRYQENN